MFGKEKANAFGKNPDYWFLQGINYMNLRDFENSIKAYQRGLKGSIWHLLCRFNLGYTLFKVGHYQAACDEYETIRHQYFHHNSHPVSIMSLVFFNSSACEF